MVNYTAKLLKGAGVLFLMSIFASLLSYLIRLVLARKLTPEEFGLFFAVYNIILIVGWVKGFGLSSSIQKYIPEFKLKGDLSGIKSLLVFVFSSTFVISILLFLLFFLLPTSFIDSYFKSNLGRPLLLILLVFIFIDGFTQLFGGFFLALYSFALYAMRDLIIRSVILLLLLFLQVGVLGVGWIYVAGTAVALLVNTLFFFTKFKFFQYRVRKDKKLFKEVFAFGIPLVIRDFFGTIMSYTDNLMLVYFRPLTEVAVYNVILPSADLLLVLGRPFGRVIFPISAELLALGEKEKLLLLVRRVQKYLFVVLTPLTVFIFVFANILLSRLFGPTYGQGFVGLRVLLFGFLFSCLSIINYNVLLGLGQSKEATKATIAANILNVILNLLLIPLFGKFNRGYLGAITATLFSSLVLFSLLSHYLRKGLGSIFPLRQMFSIAFVGFIFLPLGLLMINSFANIYLPAALFCLLLASVYPLILYLFGIISIEEFTAVVKLLKKKEK